MILVPAAVPRTAPALRRLIDPAQRPAVLAGLTVEALPPGVHVEQLPCTGPESATVVLAGRLIAADRILSPGEALHHRSGRACRFTAVRGAPTVLLTVRPVASEAAIPSQRSNSHPADDRRRVTVETVKLAPGEVHGVSAGPGADAFLLVLSGTGGFLDTAGEASLYPGDLLYLRAGERCGLRAGPRGPVTAVLGRAGALAPGLRAERREERARSLP
ncbi:hypothetical protein [Kitasatospora sp. NPDC048538]|uniref:hypothetical protein n=1 Tax=unclassified Kitasatospora TaxID=2633591 RepID=UPI0033D2B466